MPEEYAQRGNPARVYGIRRLRSGAGPPGGRNCRNECVYTHMPCTFQHIIMTFYED